MAGRIRTIKPEWLESETLLECSDAARVLSVALILLADDWGSLKASPRLLAAKAWPLHGKEAWGRAEEALQELLSRGFVVHHGDGAFLFLVGWFEHQKVDKPGRPRCPIPPIAGRLMPKSWREKYAAVAAKYELSPLVLDDSPPIRAATATTRDDSRTVATSPDPSRLTIDHDHETIDHETVDHDRTPGACGPSSPPDPVPVAWLEQAPWGPWSREPPWAFMSPKQKQALDTLVPLTRAEVEWAKAKVELAGGQPNFGLLASKIRGEREKPSARSRGSPNGHRGHHPGSEQFADGDVRL